MRNHSRATDIPGNSLGRANMTNPINPLLAPTLDDAVIALLNVSTGKRVSSKLWRRMGYPLLRVV